MSVPPSFWVWFLGCGWLVVWGWSGLAWLGGVGPWFGSGGDLSVLGWRFGRVGGLGFGFGLGGLFAVLVCGLGGGVGGGSGGGGLGFGAVRLFFLFVSPLPAVVFFGRGPPPKMRF